jgi:peptide/nickel transport system permease protein
VAIAIALTGEPDLLVADEPTTALDVTVQAEILDLLRDLQQRNGMALILVTHDLGVVADICDRAVVMYAGQVVEQGRVEDVFVHPQHPYTKGLLESSPHVEHVDNQLGEAHLPTIPGTVPLPAGWPSGCRFAERCFQAEARCSEARVPLTISDSREVRCLKSLQGVTL